ncbi:hypothetical protein H6503_00590 [Candidatus Woesearchaeota archaeon]|nr:hypothetical protein [Candidatus Woesearchaeota archaeon]
MEEIESTKEYALKQIYKKKPWIIEDRGTRNVDAETIKWAFEFFKNYSIHIARHTITPCMGNETIDDVRLFLGNPRLAGGHYDWFANDNIALLQMRYDVKSHPITPEETRKMEFALEQKKSIDDFVSGLKLIQRVESPNASYVKEGLLYIPKGLFE